MPTHWGTPVQRLLRTVAGVLTALLVTYGLSGCAGNAVRPTTPQHLPSARVVLIGEQHDAPDHHRHQQRMIGDLIAQNTLTALLLEMADDGATTAHMPADASEALVQQALGWNSKAWPWQDYAPSIMLAVRAGVPVLGANLPRARMPAAMADTSMDTRVPAAVWAHQLAEIEASHCGHIPQDRIPAMARIQIARDERMARTLGKAIGRLGQATAQVDQAPSSGGLTPAQTTPVAVLLAGSAHVLRRTGIPVHLQTLHPAVGVEIVVLKSANTPAPSALDVSTVIETSAVPEQDYCAQMAPASR